MLLLSLVQASNALLTLQEGNATIALPSPKKTSPIKKEPVPLQQQQKPVTPNPKKIGTTGMYVGINTLSLLQYYNVYMKL